MTFPNKQLHKQLWIIELIIKCSGPDNAVFVVGMRGSVSTDDTWLSNMKNKSSSVSRCLLLLKGLLKGSGREKVSEWLLFDYRCCRHTSGHTRLPSMEGLIISDKIYSGEYELKMHCLCSGPWDLFFIHFLEPSKSTRSTAHIMDSFKLFVWSQCYVLFIRVFLTGQVQIPPHFTPFQTVFFGFAPIEHDPGLCGGLV